MAYSDEQTQTWGKKALAIFLGVIAFALGKVVVSGGFYYFDHRPENIGAKFDEAIQADSAMAEMYGVLKVEYPEEYSALRSEFIAKASSGATGEELRLLGFQRMRALARENVANIARSSSEGLAQWRETNLAVINLLQSESPELCAHFATTGLQSWDRPSQEALRLISAAVSASFRAATEGRRNPINRSAEPTESDAIALLDAMSALGATDRQIALLDGGAALDQASAEDQCSAGVSLYRALDALPPEQADRLTAVIIAGIAAQ